MISACGGFQLIRCLNMGDGVDATQKQKTRMKTKSVFRRQSDLVNTWQNFFAVY